MRTERPARSATGLLGWSPVRKTECDGVEFRTSPASLISSGVNQVYVGPAGGSDGSSERTPDRTRLSHRPTLRTAPAIPACQIRRSSAATAIAEARYQKTSTLVLSQAQGWKTIRLATRKTSRKGASRTRVRGRRTSELSSATSSSGQNAPVFLSQNHGPLSGAASQPT